MDWYGFAAKIRQIRVIRVPNSKKIAIYQKIPTFGPEPG